MNEKRKYVWYASYGSNINKDRFICYIKGGKPEGSAKVETGCKNPDLPVDESTFEIHYPLYFAKEAERWEFKGVAFIGLNRDPNNSTLSKMYLITEEQFLDIVKQENNGVEFDIDLNEVKTTGSKIFRENSWYGNILYLGESKEYPIFSFTSPWDMEDVENKKPAHAYLKTIIIGLKDAYTNEEIFKYFKAKPGIEGHYSDEELESIIFNS